MSSSTSSTTYTVIVGPRKIAHHVDRDLLARIPYFEGLFSFSYATDNSEKDQVILDSEVDTDEAFIMILQYVTEGGYQVPQYYDAIAQARVHSEVYAMSDRLMIMSLKSISARWIVRSLARYDENGVYHRDKTVKRTSDGSWYLDSVKVSNIDPKALSQILKTIYVTVPCPSPLWLSVTKFCAQKKVFHVLVAEPGFGETLSKSPEFRGNLQRAMVDANCFSLNILLSESNSTSLPW